jgi:hypothetical protein
MLHADMAFQEHMTQSIGGSFHFAPRKRQNVSNRRSFLKVTWSSVELDGDNLSQDTFDVAVSTAVEALKLARSNDREELLVNDIAPGLDVGSVDIPEIQQRLENIIAEACARIGQDRPEMRLSLRGNCYDLRCYLGRTKPTDYRFDPDA